MEDPKNSTPQPEEDKKQPEDTTTPQPAPEVADIPPAMATGTMPKKSKKKWLIAAGIVAAVILLAGASAAAYYGVIQPRQPKYVVARALGNTLSKDQLKSARYEGDFKITDKKEDKTYKGTFTCATILSLRRTGSLSCQSSGSTFHMAKVIGTVFCILELTIP